MGKRARIGKNPLKVQPRRKRDERIATEDDQGENHALRPTLKANVGRGGPGDTTTRIAVDGTVMRRVTLYFSVDEYKALRLRAAEADTTMTDVVRRVLQEHLGI